MLIEFHGMKITFRREGLVASDYPFYFFLDNDIYENSHFPIKLFGTRTD